MAASNPAISVDGLTKHYGEVHANHEVSFDVDTGEIFGFLGPNGAGKSTTIRMLLGFVEPDRGAAKVLGRDVLDERELVEVKRRAGYMPGEYSFHEKLTGDECLDYFEAMRGGERRQELSEKFTPPLDRAVGEYSTGNKQKLALVQAFMHDPDVVVMDEPTSGLDPLVQRRVYDFLRGERDDGKTVFFSSHVLSEVEKIADRVGIIRDGEMVAVEDIEEVKAKSGKVLEIETEEEVSTEEFEAHFVENVESTEPEHGGSTRLTMVVTGDYDSAMRKLTNYSLVDVTMRETNLEDVFMHYYA